MAGINEVIVRLVADIKEFQAKMDNAERKVKGFGATADATSSKLSGFANKAATAITGAGLAIGAVSIKMAMDFEEATTQLVTGAGESEKALDGVRKGILAMAGQVGQTPVELAKGLYMIESAGYHGAAGLKVLKAAAQGAATGGADMATVANAVTTAMNDYHAPVDSANQVTSALIATVASGKTHLDDLANSLGRVLPTASALKIPMASVLGSVAALTNTGMSARLATTDLNAAIVGLSAPSATASKSMAAFGLSAQGLVDTMQNPRKGVAYAFETITESIGKKFPVGSAAYLAALKDITGSTMGMKVALDLTGSSFKGAQQNVKNIGDAYKNGKKDVAGFSIASKDAAFQLKQLKASGSASFTQIGQFLLPAAKDVALWAAGVMVWFKSHPLITKIASDGAIALFAGAVALKIKNGISAAIEGVKSLFGMGEKAAQKVAQTALTDAIVANTAATEANTIALGGKGSNIVSRVVETATTGTSIAEGVGSAVSEGATAVATTAGVGLYALALEKILMAAGGASNIANMPDFKKPWGTAGMMPQLKGQIQIQAAEGDNYAYISTAQIKTLQADITKLKAANKGVLNKADYYKVVQSLAIADMPNIPAYKSQIANINANTQHTVTVKVK